MSLLELPSELIEYIIFKMDNVIDIVNLSVCSRKFNSICRDCRLNKDIHVYDIK